MAQSSQLHSASIVSALFLIFVIIISTVGSAASTFTLGPDPTYPRGEWERIWYIYSGNPSNPWAIYLGLGSNQSDLKFDETDWGSGVVTYGRSDQVGFVSSRIVNISSGTWTFTVGGDDGVRLYIDERLAINGWKDQSYRTYTYTETFASTGDHKLRLEWYENKGNARVSFNIEKVNVTASISAYSISSGDFKPEDSVSASLTLTNTAIVPWTFYVAYRVQDTSGKWWDASYKAISVGPRSSSGSVSLQWIVNRSAPSGWYNAELALWMNLFGTILEGQIDRKEVSNAFRVVRTLIQPSYPSGRWERIWYSYSGILGLGPDEYNLNFDNDFSVGLIAYNRSDKVGFISSRTVRIVAGTWIFTVGGDDGVRLYIDDRLAIDGWEFQSYAIYNCIVTFSSTTDHRLRLEWFDDTGDARVSFEMRQRG